MELGRETQAVINEIKTAKVTSLYFHRHMECKLWTDFAVFTSGDQGFNNRPGGKSTGGFMTVVGPKSAINGDIACLTRALGEAQMNAKSRP